MSSFNVVFLSSWFGNPYKDLLIDHLAAQQIQVTEQVRRLWFLPQVLKVKNVRILHLQTLHYLFVSRNPLYYWLKFLVFIGQVYWLKLCGIKVVWTVHEWKDKNSDGVHDLSPRKSALLGQALDRIITHCESTRLEMCKTLALMDKPEKTVVVPHGSYIGYYPNTLDSAIARKQLDIPAENVAFLLFGGIHANKGALDAIAAFKALNHPQTTLIIAGEPNSEPLRQTLRAEANTCSRLLFVDPDGPIPDEDVQLYLNACDVVLLPYRVFTTSGVALLAMSFERPCIAPAQGFFCDTFDHHSAFLYDPSTGLLAAMQTAVAEKARLPKMGRHGRAIAEAASWDVVAAKTAQVYRGLSATSVNRLGDLS